MLKLCRDCKFVADPGEFAKCNAPQNVKSMEPWTGFPDENERRKWSYCSQHRNKFWLDAVIFGFCGKSGRWWRSKQ